MSLTFSFQNGQGEKEDKEGGVWSEPFSSTDNPDKVSGVMIHQMFKKMGCVYGIAARHKVCIEFFPLIRTMLSSVRKSDILNLCEQG